MKMLAVLLIVTLSISSLSGNDPEIEFQRLKKNVTAIQKFLPEAVTKELSMAFASKTTDAIDRTLVESVSLKITINPEGRVRVNRGPSTPTLKVDVATPLLVRIENQSGGQQRLKPVAHYTGEGNPFELAFATVDGFDADLKGELIEYRLLNVTCTRTGKREVTIAFQAGQGTQDLGFRGETPVLFEVK
jgi:hypothetical protein